VRRLPTGATHAPAAFDPAGVQAFCYLGFEWDDAAGTLVCRYALDDLEFEEHIGFGAPPPHDETMARRACRLIYLLAGVSYFKAACPPVIDLGDDALTPAERRLLEAFYVDGLGEFAYRNDLDLRRVRIQADRRDASAPPLRGVEAGFPLVPFGGGIDSIVSVEAVRATHPEARLFVLNDFPAIESSVPTTGLSVVRALRRIDPALLDLNAQGAYNGHVPVTGILSAIAVAAAVLHGASEVVMSNEWSASQGNVERHGRLVNHQWSKSLEFEDLFRAVLHESLGDAVDYFSLLRPFTSLRIAESFADQREYFATFRSCNRAFHIAPSARQTGWCGQCDKCCFVDLVLAPFVPARELADVFGGNEPLRDPSLRPQFEALLGLSGDAKPWECVGDVNECRASAFLGAQREDRAGDWILQELSVAALRAHPSLPDDIPAMLRPIGPHHVPAPHAAPLGLG
jgi:UDP-N-acetyl-alpha-D-muramoyl-L-alanyl-L-glutamate epimerase